MAVPGKTGRAAKPATALTAALNAAIVVPPPDTDPELALAQRGLVEAWPADFTVYKAGTKVPIWSLAEYSRFLDVENAPDTVNPSLWRNARLNMNCGLYEVVPNAVYQVRGADLSNISFLEDPTGASQQIVVVDPLVSAECAQAALQLYRGKRGAQRTIVAVIFTHSHVDHYGGARGLFGADGPGSKVEFVAPDGFLEHAVSENVYAGTAMTRRATFMYGMILPKSAEGQVDSGLGKTSSTGTVGLIAPTTTITDKLAGKTLHFGPIGVEFQLTPGTEAPAEMNFYLPDIKTLCMAENATPTLHNLYSLRGAQVRDAKAWSQYLNDAIESFGARTQTMFACHFWPRWKSAGGNEIVDFLTKQADLYRYLHDQSLRVSNQGRTLVEVAEDLDQALPPSLADEWYNHGYYGTTNHDIKAVYQRYLGWFDGNAAHLHGLPPQAVGPRYVEAIGGADRVVAIAGAAFVNATSQDDYRWAAELLSHAVFADPAHVAARELAADVLEQLGYQAESGPWRNFYLAGADELRYRPLDPPPVYRSVISPDVITAMSLGMVFDYMGIRLDGPRTADLPLRIGLNVTGGLPTDPTKCTLQLRDSVLFYIAQPPSSDADAFYTITRAGLNSLALGEATPEELLASGQLTIDAGTIDPLDTLTDLLVNFNSDFAITTP